MNRILMKGSYYDFTERKKLVERRRSLSDLPKKLL